MPAKRVPLLALIALGLALGEASGLVVYRIGTPFSAAERDSLGHIGVDFRELAWSASLLREGLDIDSLGTGSLQPEFWEEDEDLAAGLLTRGGGVGSGGPRWRQWSEWTARDQRSWALIDRDPTTGCIWPLIPPSWTSSRALWKVILDLGGQFRVREVKFRTLRERPGHYPDEFQIAVSEGALVWVRDYPNSSQS